MAERKYSKKAQDEVAKAIHKEKRGQQRSGKTGKATSREQAIAIGLSKAREKGAKVPAAPKKKSSTTSKSSSAKSASAKGRTTKVRTAAKKASARTSSRASSRR